MFELETEEMDHLHSMPIDLWQRVLPMEVVVVLEATLSYKQQDL